MQTVNGVRMKAGTVKRLGLTADEPETPTKRRTSASDKARRSSPTKARVLNATGTAPEESDSGGNTAGES